MKTDSMLPHPAGDALEIRSEPFRRVQEMSPDGFMLFRSLRDAAGGIVDFACLYANPAAQAITRSAGPLAGTRLLEEFPASRRPPIFQRCLAAVERGRSWKGVFRYRLGGTDHWLRAMIVRVEDGFAVTFFDVTATIRRERERERPLRQAQKMEVVGRLASGVAHDFNNLLTVIKGNAELGLMEISPIDPVRESLEEITRAASRAADLTRQLLACSRPQVPQPKVFNLNATVSSMKKLLQRIREVLDAGRPAVFLSDHDG